MLIVSTFLAPYLSIAQPVTGDNNVDANAPALAAPAIRVMLHPKYSCIGNIKIDRVRVAAAFLTIRVDPDVIMIIQP